MSTCYHVTGKGIDTTLASCEDAIKLYDDNQDVHQVDRVTKLMDKKYSTYTIRQRTGDKEI